MVQNDNDTPRYLFTVEYDEEAERKRVEYLFNNWDSGQITAPSGLVRIAEGIDREELHEQLLTKVPEEQVDVYELETTAMDIETEREVVEQEITASLDAVETFLDYVFSKKKAVLQSSSRNEYEVYTKKGRAEVSYDLQATGDTVTVRVRVNGYPPAPSFLAEFCQTELSEYAASQTNEQA